MNQVNDKRRSARLRVPSSSVVKNITFLNKQTSSVNTSILVERTANHDYGMPSKNQNYKMKKVKTKSTTGSSARSSSDSHGLIPKLEIHDTNDYTVSLLSSLSKEIINDRLDAITDELKKRLQISITREEELIDIINSYELDLEAHVGRHSHHRDKIMKYDVSTQT